MWICGTTGGAYIHHFYCCSAGLHVPLSVALSQGLRYQPSDINNTVQYHGAQDLNILVAVTSTCCTQQVSCVDQDFQGSGIVCTLICYW